MIENYSDKYNPDFLVPSKRFKHLIHELIDWLEQPDFIVEAFTKIAFHPRGKFVHIYWDGFRDIPSDQRTKIAYHAINQTIGCMEARENGLLPYVNDFSGWVSSHNFTIEEAVNHGFLPYEIIPYEKYNVLTSGKEKEHPYLLNCFEEMLKLNGSFQFSNTHFPSECLLFLPTSRLADQFICKLENALPETKGKWIVNKRIPSEESYYNEDE